MLEYNEISVKKCIIYEGEPYEVLSSHVFRKQQRKPVNATKLRNLVTGRVVEHSFHQNEKAEEADIEKRQEKFLFANKGAYWFCEPKNPANRFTIEASSLGDTARFLQQNMLVDVKLFEDKYIGVALPIKMDLKVTEAAPGIRGDTAQGGTKTVTLETGATLNVPLFVQEGDIITVNTETGDYVSRGGK
ncbi:MAG: elongation factor P [Candidatus Vogelbacteria bacterium CG10_big_fil_rev_8_21_14_0_10_51_16]|uniref:Elongation factor P n=1 Tax=Candidatus Vogelbacteria bacterium CG10_big_fil_rev_8_21_14_0_10_51_16 TaxID=1975045 RepID=A0A2H0RF55_9BACT|nr:MAG: elongation factor P [Candidatus Vogelbacteria bacterium CG10_big_fil_rev_8_21_14_0_10_51_16]